VRIGFSVSKRVGGAVTRNLVKRRLREAVRHRLAALADGWDLVLTALPSASGVDFATLGAELDDLFTRAGVWLTTHNSRGLK
jgi:ribonuclease P protein component